MEVDFTSRTKSFLVYFSAIYHIDTISISYSLLNLIHAGEEFIILLYEMEKVSSHNFRLTADEADLGCWKNYASCIVLFYSYTWT